MEALLTLSDLLPVPIQHNPGIEQSDIWNKTLTIHQGSKVFIQAPSGRGKTTLIHAIYGMRKDYRGTIVYQTQNIAQAGKEQIAQIRKEAISIIFQDLRLSPYLTLWENLLLKKYLYKDALTEQELEAYLQELGIYPKKDSLCSTLSYGEQQRAAIIRALIQPFSLLIMDEPFSHLDTDNTQLAARLILRRCEELGAAFIIADLDENNYFPYNHIYKL